MNRKARKKARALAAEEEGKEGPRLSIKLYMWDFKQCDPKVCTGAKLKRLKFVETISIGHTFKGIVLT